MRYVHADMGIASGAVASLPRLRSALEWQIWGDMAGIGDNAAPSDTGREEWTFASLARHMEMRVHALQELKTHDLKSFHYEIAQMEVTLRGIISATEEKALRATDASDRLLHAQLDGLEKLAQSRFIAQENALAKATTAMETRFESVNEFRQVLSDQARRYVSMETIDARFAQNGALINSINDKVDALTARVAALDAKFWLGGSGVIVVITVIQLLVNVYRG